MIILEHVCSFAHPHLTITLTITRAGANRIVPRAPSLTPRLKLVLKLVLRGTLDGTILTDASKNASQGNLLIGYYDSVWLNARSTPSSMVTQTITGAPSNVPIRPTVSATP